MKHTLQKLIIISSALSPSLVFAAAPRNLTELIGKITGYINLLIPIVASLALLAFFYGAGQVILHADSEDVREKAKYRLMYGLIAIFVMISIFGLVNLLSSTLLG